MDQLSPKEADQAMARFKEESTPDTTSNGQTLVFDTNMQPHVFTHTTTSHKSFSGAGGGPSAQPSPPSVTTPPNGSAAPNTLAGVKKSAAKLNPPASSATRTPKSPIGPALDFYKTNPESTKLSEQHDTAVELVSEAEDALANPTNGEMQFLLVDNLLHGALGRVNEIEIKRIQDRGGWFMAPDRWEAEASSGTMAPQLVKQLRDFTISQKKAIEKAQATHGGTSPDSSGGSSTPNAGSKSVADKLREVYEGKK